MGVLQGLIGFLQKTSRKLLQAIFGWAVNALFGTPKESEKTVLSAVVAVAAGWPLLLVGVAFPKAAAFILAFIPIPKWVPPAAIRIVWIAAAVLVPLSVGLVLARRGDVHLSGESFWQRAARGVPVTVAIGSAFVVAFFTTALRHLVALSRRWQEEHLPLLLEPEDYAPGAEALQRALGRADIDVHRAEPPWLLTAPSRVIRALGGRTLRDRIPKNFHFYRQSDLEVAVMPNGITLRGKPELAARAHGILSEEATLLPGLQTTAPEAQVLEKRLKDVWRVWRADPRSHGDSRVLLAALEDTAKELDATFVPYEQWQVLYREILQMQRAVAGRPQLLEKVEEKNMEPKSTSFRNSPLRSATDSSLRSLSTADLIARTTREIGRLVREEVDLAKAEFRRDLEKQLAMARLFGLAALAALLFLNMLFVAAALWLSRFLEPWASALVVAGALLLTALGFAFAGWKKRIRPLEATRKTVKENWQWAKNRVA
jgi:hypothetical protein